MKIEKNIQKAINIIFMAILILIVWYNFMNINNSKEFINVLGYKFMVVEEYQQQKGLKANTLIIAKNMNNEYNIEDLVVIDLNGNTYVHRIIEIKGSNMYITKGDGNYKVNSPIEGEKIHGKVISQIPYLGLILKIIKSKAFSIIIIFSLFILLIYNRRKYKRNMYRRIKQKQQK